MSVDRIAKLYAGLTNKERAALAFRYLAEQNQTEVDRVTATVPRATYTSLDPEYLRWLNGLHHLATAWGLEHWQLQARRWAAHYGVHYFSGDPDERLVTAMARASRVAEARLLALDQAMGEVCQKHGIAVEAVRQLSKAEPISPLAADVVPDDDFLSEVREALTCIFATMERQPNV